MKKIEEKLENFLAQYADDLTNQPIKTVIKTLFIIWIVSKIIKMIKS